MTLYAADGSSFSWQIAKDAAVLTPAFVSSGVSATKPTRRAHDSRALQRYRPWRLRAESAIRDFDGRSVLSRAGYTVGSL